MHAYRLTVYDYQGQHRALRCGPQRAVRRAAAAAPAFACGAAPARPQRRTPPDSQPLSMQTRTITRSSSCMRLSSCGVAAARPLAPGRCRRAPDSDAAHHTPRCRSHRPGLAALRDIPVQGEQPPAGRRFVHACRSCCRVSCSWHLALSVRAAAALRRCAAAAVQQAAASSPQAERLCSLSLTISRYT